MKLLLHFILCVWLSGLASGPAWALRIIEHRRVGTAPPARLQKLELGLALATAPVQNPYDPAEITVGAEFTSPSGVVHRAVGFWYQDFRRCTTCAPFPRQSATDTCTYCTTCPEDPRYLVPVPTRLPWRIRFAPPEAGRWSYRLLVRHHDSSTVSAPTYFTVAAAENPGFVRVHPNGRNFAFADGRVFFPLGMNVVNNGVEERYTRLPYQDVRDGIRKIADNGGNFARLMLMPGQFSPEGADGPAGRYDARQNRAYDLDALVEQAARRRVYLQIALSSVTDISDNGEVGQAWERHPYRQRLGPGAPPIRFFTDSVSRQLFRQRIRYVVARWGYSPAIFGLEMMNEADLFGGKADNFWNPGNSARVGSWVREMIAYARTLAPQYLYTSSLGYAFSGDYPGPDGKPLYQAPELDFVQDHYYSSDLNVEHQRAYLARRAAVHFPGKPYQLAEFGLGIEKQCWYGSSNFTAPRYPPGVRYHDLIEMHNTLWSSAFNGSGGAALYWWANQVFGLCYGGQYHYFKPLQLFLAGSPIFSEDYEVLASACPGTAGPKDTPHTPTTPGNCVPVWAAGSPVKDTVSLEPGGAFTSDARLEVFALRSPARVLGWVHNRASYWYQLPHQAGSFTDTSCLLFNDNQPSTPDSVPALVGQTVSLPSMARPGRYRLEFFSTYPFYALSAGGPVAQGGRITQFTTEVRTDAAGQLTFTVPPLRPLGRPPFAPDYGFRATWLPDGAPKPLVRPAAAKPAAGKPAVRKPATRPTVRKPAGR
jgi:prepilin-type processing-associated H-X9-DG protein